MLRNDTVRGQGKRWITLKDKDEDGYCGDPYLISQVFSHLKIKFDFYIFLLQGEKYCMES